MRKPRQRQPPGLSRPDLQKNNPDPQQVKAYRNRNRNRNQNLSLSQQTNLLLAQSVNNTMAAGMIGQTIVANGNEVQLSEGEEAK